MPPVILLRFAYPDWAPLSLSDLKQGYLLFAPFTVVGAFAVAWPSYRLQRVSRPVSLRIVVSALICAMVGVLMLIPLSDRLPWEGAIYAVLTFLVWLSAYQLVGQLPLFKTKQTRSEPSG